MWVSEERNRRNLLWKNEKYLLCYSFVAVKQTSPLNSLENKRLFVKLDVYALWNSMVTIFRNFFLPRIPLPQLLRQRVCVGEYGCFPRWYLISCVAVCSLREVRIWGISSLLFGIQQVALYRISTAVWVIDLFLFIYFFWYYFSFSCHMLENRLVKWNFHFREYDKILNNFNTRCWPWLIFFIFGRPWYCDVRD